MVFVRLAGGWLLNWRDVSHVEEGRRVKVRVENEPEIINVTSGERYE